MSRCRANRGIRRAMSSETPPALASYTERTMNAKPKPLSNHHPKMSGNTAARPYRAPNAPAMASMGWATAARQTLPARAALGTGIRHEDEPRHVTDVPRDAEPVPQAVLVVIEFHAPFRPAPGVVEGVGLLLLLLDPRPEPDEHVHEGLGPVDPDALRQVREHPEGLPDVRQEEDDVLPETRETLQNPRCEPAHLRSHEGQVPREDQGEELEQRLGAGQLLHQP